jgi:hypothetical protein
MANWPRSRCPWSVWVARSTARSLTELSSSRPLRTFRNLIGQRLIAAIFLCGSTPACSCQNLRCSLRTCPQLVPRCLRVLQPCGQQPGDLGPTTAQIQRGSGERLHRVTGRCLLSLNSQQQARELLSSGLTHPSTVSHRNLLSAFSAQASRCE